MAKQDVTVELFYSGVWNTVEAYTRDPITITRGRGDEQSEFVPSTASLTLSDRVTSHNPKDPTSPLFGLVGRNTPIRITRGATDRRFYGEVASYKPRRTEDFNRATGRGDAWTEIEAAGITRRLGQGNQPEESPMRRTIAASGPVAYWPVEDGAAAGRAGSAIPGHPALAVAGLVEFKELEDYTFAGSVATRYGTSALADLAAGGGLSAAVPADVTAATAGVWTVGAFAGVNFSTLSGDITLLEWTTPGGTYATWRLVITTGSQTNVVGVTGGGAATTLINFPSSTTGSIVYSVSAEQVGGNIEIDLRRGGLLEASATVAGTLAGVTSVGSNPSGVTSSAQTPCGHLQVFAANTLPYDARGETLDSHGVVVGHARNSWGAEIATDRLARLALDAGLTLDMPAVTYDFATRMGWQPVATFAALLAEIEHTDDGLLYEPRDAAGLAYRPRESLYNQAPALELDFAAGEVAPPLDPVVDDLGTRNDVTVERERGSSARAALQAGPLSVLPPPAGVGRVTTKVDVNTSDDIRLADFANWHLRKGTVDATRYPRVTVDLDAVPALATAASAVDIGDVITVANTEEGGASLLVLGYTETIGSHRRKITFNTTPYAPWLWITDTFSRTVAGGWGTSDSGHVWGTSDTALSVTGGLGRITHTSAGVVENVLAATNIADLTVKVSVNINATLTGSGAIAPGVMVRHADAANRYHAVLFYQTSGGPTGTVGLILTKRVAGVDTNLYTNFAWDVYNGSEQFWLKIQCIGSTVRLKAWRTTVAEPAAWTAEATDTAHASGAVGLRSERGAGVTNVNPFVQFDDFAEVRF